MTTTKEASTKTLERFHFLFNPRNALTFLLTHILARKLPPKPQGAFQEYALIAMLALTVIFFAPSSSHAENVAEIDGYKQSHYKSPVPSSLNGAIVIDTIAAHTLWQNRKALFIDVLPRPPAPKNIDKSKWHHKVRKNIPNGFWLPNVGFGKLHPDVKDYFVRNLARLTNGKTDAALVFYCLSNCWMSWNAAKRALELGYSNVYWFPEGTDGWQEEGFELTNGLPETQ